MSKVDFPLPDCPMIERNSFSVTLNETPRSAWVLTAVPYSLVTLSMLMVSGTLDHLYRVEARGLAVGDDGRDEGDSDPDSRGEEDETQLRLDRE